MAIAPSSRTSQDVVAAIDLGGTKVSSALFPGEAAPLGRRVVPLAGRAGDAVGTLIVDEIERLQSVADEQGCRLRTIGVCVPGIVQGDTRNVWAPNIPGWDDYPLLHMMRSAVAGEGHDEVHFVLTNDRAASILGEAWQGVARGRRHAIFLAVGTGIGAGILSDGKVIEGAHGIAGAIGWWALDRPYQAEYKGCGCFESHASGEGMARRARAVLARRPGYDGSLLQETEVSAQAIFAAYETHDEIATEVLANAVEYWGMASANLVSLFNPEMVVFGGGVFGPATRWIDDILAIARKWGQPVAMQHVTFAASRLGGDAALYGAAYLAQEGEMTHGLP